MKEAIGIIAVLLAFVAYAPYLRDIVRGKTKPHTYTWFVWGLVTSIIFALQLQSGGGAGAYVTLSAAVLSFVVCGLSLRYGKSDITKIDTVFLLAALLSLVIWLYAKQPVISTLLLVSIDMFGFLPTIRKSWNAPFEETLFTWGLNGFRHSLSLFALDNYNVNTTLYPATWAFANLAFTVLLLLRRRSLQNR
jgi:hypothetical protein